MSDESLDLGLEPEKPKEGAASPTCSEPPPEVANKKCYPTLCFRDRHAELFRKKYGNCALNDEYEMTVKLKVSGVAQQRYNDSIDFDVLSIIGDVVEQEGGAEDNPKEEAAEKPNGKKKPPVAEKLESSY